MLWRRSVALVVALLGAVAVWSVVSTLVYIFGEKHSELYSIVWLVPAAGVLWGRSWIRWAAWTWSDRSPSARERRSQRQANGGDD